MGKAKARHGSIEMRVVVTGAPARLLEATRQLFARFSFA